MSSHKNIMVVEDTASVADLIREMLLCDGHHVDIYPTVEEALAKFAPGKYELIITDYTMPGMNGVELARRLRSQAPEQTILLITGSTFSIHESNLAQAPLNAVLQKPFSVPEFLEVVVRLLQPKCSTPAVPPQAGAQDPAPRANL